MTTFKVLNIGDPGTGTRLGSNDSDKIARMLNGENITDPCGPIDTDFIFKSNKLILRDLSNTVNIHFITSVETVPGSITIPPLNGDVVMLLDNDTRLYDSRTPVVHAITHTAGEPDEILLDQLGVPADTAFLNVTADYHGLAPKLPADGLLYLDGNGNWTAPSGTGVLNDGSITGAKLADDTVTAEKIAPAAITADRIAVAAGIPYSKLTLTGSVTNADLSSEVTIDWGKINKSGSKLQDMSDVNLAGIADGSSIKWSIATSQWVIYAPGAGGNVPDDLSVSTAKIQNAAVTTAKIAGLAVTTGLIADGNVTLGKLATNSVDASKIVDGSIMNAEINSAAAITWTKISKAGSSINNFDDTYIVSPIPGQALIWNGGDWANQDIYVAPASSGDSADPTGGYHYGWIIGGPADLNDAEIGGGLLEHTQAINICNAGADSSGSYTSLTTTSTSQTNAQFSSKNDTEPFLPSLNPKLYVKFKMPNAGNIRMYIGFTNVTPVNTVTFDTLDGRIGMGIRFDTTNDSKFVVLNNNGGGTATETVTGVTPGSGTIYTLSIECSGGTWTLKLNGSTLRSTSSNVPTTGIGWGAMVNTHTSAVRNLDVYHVRVQQDA